MMAIPAISTQISNDNNLKPGGDCRKCLICSQQTNIKYTSTNPIQGMTLARIQSNPGLSPADIASPKGL